MTQPYNWGISQAKYLKAKGPSHKQTRVPSFWGLAGVSICQRPEIHNDSSRQLLNPGPDTYPSNLHEIMGGWQSWGQSHRPSYINYLL